jgi:hypothetical protein
MSIENLPSAVAPTCRDYMLAITNMHIAHGQYLYITKERMNVPKISDSYQGQRQRQSSNSSSRIIDAISSSANDGVL